MEISIANTITKLKKWITSRKDRARAFVIYSDMTYWQHVWVLGKMYLWDEYPRCWRQHGGTPDQLKKFEVKGIFRDYLLNKWAGWTKDPSPYRSQK